MRRTEGDRRDARWALWMAGAALVALLANGIKERAGGSPATVTAATASLAAPAGR